MAAASVRGVPSKLGNVFQSLKAVSSAPRSYFTYTPEPAQPIKGKEPKWVASAEEAFQDLKSGDTVFAQGAAATPIEMLKGMTEVGKKKKLKDVRVCHMHTEGPAPYCAPECDGIFRSFSFFMGGNVRKAVAEGRGDALPIFLSEIPILFYKKIIEPTYAVIQVSPPDQHGYCSLGTSVDCVRAGMSHSKIIVAQVNPNMPRTFGDGIIHISHIDYACKVDQPLPTHGGQPPTEVEKQIGKNIAENLVEDGATLQMGIGSIPDAVLACLHDHKDLGIHSEMFAGGVIDLVNRGCVTNNKKKIHKGRIVGSFLIGTQALYDFVDNNPFVEMLVVDYVNSTKIVSQMPKMTAINSCIEVDLTGQVNSDSIGTRMYSGFGGQVDFIRGAAEGFDGKGKPIIAMPSTTNKGESKIAPICKPDSKRWY
ncbi:unnamed protein product [Acanthoscelides obtectus]|uniref:Acetyl-CoA hydrolase n=2 Tax=Acanthoscelides obtectus TaxID=200917 RepID=A0A9P0Q0U5_ACAOB|nr:unnamed protein product [Acanthoscelides obtectus]CAK1644959.1 4-hydroxybutyrate coenzyme A transferase [Acanthoscelides obtectus]